MIELPKPWRLPLLGLALAWAALALLFFDTGAAMVEIWNRSETFAHAWVVPPISAWLVWRLRGELGGITPRPAPRWLLWLLPLGLLWLVGDLAAANAATQFAFVGILVVLVPAMLGGELAGRIAFALGFLFFAVPFGDFMTPWLIDRTADFTVAALRFTGIPVFREGTQFIIPTGTWSVVQACSGIRYLVASVMVGTLFAYLNYNGGRKRWIFVGVAIITPLIANWLRAYMIVMLGHLSGNRLAVGVDHLIYGWVFFGIVMLTMFMIGSRWVDPVVAPPPPAPVSPATTGRPAVVLLAALVLLALPLVLRAQVQQAGSHVAPRLSAPQLPGWAWTPEAMSTWRPAFVNPAATLHGRYQEPAGAAVGVYIGYYRDQRAGRQLVTSVNQLINIDADKEWAVIASGRAEQDGQAWRSAELRGEALGQAGGDQAPRLRAWQTYWINGRPFTSDWQAKLYGVWRSLLGQGDDAAVVILYATKADAGPNDALLHRFAHQYWGQIATALRDVRDRDARRQP